MLHNLNHNLNLLLLLINIYGSVAIGTNQCVMKIPSVRPSPTPSPSPVPSPIPEGRMTNRFPLGCKSKYISPFKYESVSSVDKLCFKIQNNECNTDTRCSKVQGSARKFMISTLQIPLCGSKQVYREGPSSSAARDYKPVLLDSNENEISGSSMTYFWHTWQNKTETATDLYIKPQSDLSNYKICISGVNVKTCLLNKDKKMCISTYDVSDHSCDNCQLIDFS